MKSLSESLFDGDLTTRPLLLEKVLKNFNSDDLQGLSVEERNAVFDQLFEIGEQCNMNDLRKSLIDLTENVIIMRDNILPVNDIGYPMKYYFVYAINKQKDPETLSAVLLCNSVTLSLNNRLSYYWDVYPLSNFDKKRTWKQKITTIYNPKYSYSVITDKKWVENIIKGTQEG